MNEQEHKELFGMMMRKDCGKGFYGSFDYSSDALRFYKLLAQSHRRPDREGNPG
jgi:hypothetical protein